MHTYRDSFDIEIKAFKYQCTKMPVRNYSDDYDNATYDS